MKVKIAYVADEAMLATLVDQVIGNILTGARRSEYMEGVTPHRHIYYQTRKPEDLKEKKPAKGRGKPRHYKQTINGGKANEQRSSKQAHPGHVPGESVRQSERKAGKQRGGENRNQNGSGPARH